MSLTSTAFTSTGSASLTPLRARAPPPCSPSRTGRRTRTARALDGSHACIGHSGCSVLVRKETRRRDAADVWSRGRTSCLVRCGPAVAPNRDLLEARRSEPRLGTAACQVARAPDPEQGQRLASRATRENNAAGQPGADRRADPSAARRPQGRCVRASPAQMPASTRRRQFF